MAKKISDAIAKQLKKLGIKNVKTEDDAREKLLAILEKNGIEGMEDEDTESLIDMAESFIEDDDEDTDDAEAEDPDLTDEDYSETLKEQTKNWLMRLKRTKMRTRNKQKSPIRSRTRNMLRKPPISLTMMTRTKMTMMRNQPRNLLLQEREIHQKRNKE